MEAQRRREEGEKNHEPRASAGRSRASLDLGSLSGRSAKGCKVSMNARESLCCILHSLGTGRPFSLSPVSVLWACVKSALSQPPTPQLLLLTLPCGSAQGTEVEHPQRSAVEGGKATWALTQQVQRLPRRPMHGMNQWGWTVIYVFINFWSNIAKKLQTVK